MTEYTENEVIEEVIEMEEEMDMPIGWENNQIFIKENGAVKQIEVPDDNLEV